MKLDALVALCKATSPLDGKPVKHIYLTVPVKRPPRGGNVMLCGRSGPRGRICTVNEAEDGTLRCVATFSAPAVLAYIEKHAEGATDR